MWSRISWSPVLIRLFHVVPEIWKLNPGVLPYPSRRKSTIHLNKFIEPHEHKKFQTVKGCLLLNVLAVAFG